MTTSRDSGPRAGSGTAGAGSGGSPPGVSIVLNGERRLLEPGLSVAELLHDLGLDPGMVVVERNREILARRNLAGIPVADGDRYELVHFVGGG